MTLPTAEAVARAFCRRRGMNLDGSDLDGRDAAELWYWEIEAEEQLTRRREQAEWDAAIDEARG